ncbi:M56 family metallopeptidase [Acidithiobacillus sp. AMEEHan]|uniref:M56 family metallopeptidase n=1 Tax=Acidithiobacillus sp. AMEEHan TaxID=2994951 RepID=UPI0027E5A989|nr:M56 family metallopeptidase [Acidithiobacillus sp. AMEEHan]
MLMIFILLFGGLSLHFFAALPAHLPPDLGSEEAERRAWLQLWAPFLPTLFIVAWLCGWTAIEPDPLPWPLDHTILVFLSLPFLLVAARATYRAILALFLDSPELLICTAGFLRPRIVFSPFFARKLDNAQIQAAWAHEQAHAQHYDPLRIWLAQLVTDLQWPWPAALHRLRVWLAALECARDAEACRTGVAGEDLAAAILETLQESGSAKGSQTAYPMGISPALISDGKLLQLRIERLLQPQALSEEKSRRRVPRRESTLLLLLALPFSISMLLGALYGQTLLEPLLNMTWSEFWALL